MRSTRRRCWSLAGWCCCLLASGARQSASAGAAASFWGQRRNDPPQQKGDGVADPGHQHPPSASSCNSSPWGRRRSTDLASASTAFAPQLDSRSPSSADATTAADWQGRDGSVVGSSSSSSIVGATTPSSSTSSGASTSHRPERGKVLTELTPQQMYDAYRDIQRDYQARAFSAPSSHRSSSSWRVLNERDGVKVSLLQHPDDPHCPYVRMCGVIDAPVQECWNFLMVDRWDESMPKMDPFYEGVSVVGEYSHPESGVDMILCRKRTKRILAFGKRDLVFLSVVDKPLEDGTWVSGSVSVVTPHVPRQPGYTRAFQDSIAFYQPLDNNTRTNLTIVCRIDLNDSGQDGSGGWIPMWLYVKTIGVTAVESVLRMRHAIVDSLAIKPPDDEPKQ